MSRSSRRAGGRSRRGSRRAQGHDAARAEAEETPAQRVPDHPSIPKATPPPFDSKAELDELIEHVRAVGRFAYDTEFIGEETYYPRLCLIQIATSERMALIDPLGGLDLTGIWELIADPAIETLVHAGEQDLEPVVRHLGVAPANIFDTQIAAGFVNRPYPLGLRRVVEEFVGVRLGKALTFTSWDHRPLSKVHARYAADDVRYLPAAREAIDAELERFGHARWARAACDELAVVDRYRFDPDARVRRLLSARTMKPRQAAALRELVIFRDQAARDQDVPPRTLLKDDVLIRIARERVASVEALANVKGMPRPLADRHGDAILEALADAPPRAPGLPRPLPEETPARQVRVDGLWTVAASYCRGLGIDPSLIGTRRLMARALALHEGAGEPASSCLDGWAREVLGDFLDALLSGEAEVLFRWTEDGLRAVLDADADDG